MFIKRFGKLNAWALCLSVPLAIVFSNVLPPQSAQCSFAHWSIAPVFLQAASCFVLGCVGWVVALVRANARREGPISLLSTSDQDHGAFNVDGRAELMFYSKVLPICLAVMIASGVGKDFLLLKLGC
ncbi:hypothetical protein J2W35_006968 [Variovorax boronicumulans]|uniref:hypothetical protein n=1 Tax=Variovorax boronicumulans TaxID=436515 RepID=UPI002780B06C|nr:hypothetical protein [Variovorax boronicumulans]MDQ0086581.1 hypothetical protein [Variovorax boronicumulans]